jgi:hypothetical protein
MTTITVPQKWTEEQVQILAKAKNIYDLKAILKERSARSCYDKARKSNIDSSKIEGLSKLITMEKDEHLTHKDRKAFIDSFDTTEKDLAIAIAKEVKKPREFTGKQLSKIDTSLSKEDLEKRVNDTYDALMKNEELNGSYRQRVVSKFKENIAKEIIAIRLCSKRSKYAIYEALKKLHGDNTPSPTKIYGLLLAFEFNHGIKQR